MFSEFLPRKIGNTPAVPKQSLLRPILNKWYRWLKGNQRKKPILQEGESGDRDKGMFKRRVLGSCGRHLCFRLPLPLFLLLLFPPHHLRSTCAGSRMLRGSSALGSCSSCSHHPGEKHPNLLGHLLMRFKLNHLPNLGPQGLPWT